MDQETFMLNSTHSAEADSPDYSVEATPLNILRISFDELYRRHLCRHGQFGINILHLISVCGVYISVCSIVTILIRSAEPAMPQTMQYLSICILSFPYFAVLLVNIPVLTFVGTAAAACLIATAAFHDTLGPLWFHLVMILLWHRLQLWSHHLYPLRKDMSEFDGKYRKGLRLFVLLSVYELPILLHYFLCGRREWVR